MIGSILPGDYGHTVYKVSKGLIFEAWLQLYETQQDDDFGPKASSNKNAILVFAQDFTHFGRTFAVEFYEQVEKWSVSLCTAQL